LAASLDRIGHGAGSIVECCPGLRLIVSAPEGFYHQSVAVRVVEKVFERLHDHFEGDLMF